MEYIANIVTKNKVDTSDFYYVTSDFNSIKHDKPTLIIGWADTKLLFPEQDILDNKISDNIYWTFSKREKRYKHESDMVLFNKHVIDYINTKVKYRFFNYILSTKEKRENFISYVRKGNCSLYHNSRFLYIYNNTDSIIIGVSLKDLVYIGINTKTFILNLIKDTNNITCNNLNFISEDSLFIIKDNIKISPYLNYLKNFDIYK